MAQGKEQDTGAQNKTPVIVSSQLPQRPATTPPHVNVGLYGTTPEMLPPEGIYIHLTSAMFQQKTTAIRTGKDGRERGGYVRYFADGILLPEGVGQVATQRVPRAEAAASGAQEVSELAALRARLDALTAARK